MKRPLERAAIALVVNSDAGIISSANAASSGDTTNIITMVPTSVSSDVII